MFEENLAGFLVDFGVAAIYNGVTKTVLLDMPGQDLLSGRVQNTQYEMTYVESDMPGLEYGEALTVDGVAYTILSSMRIDDGAFSRAVLEQVPT